jgi:hypothetical protein
MDGGVVQYMCLEYPSTLRTNNQLPKKPNRKVNREGLSDLVQEFPSSDAMYMFVQFAAPFQVFLHLPVSHEVWVINGVIVVGPGRQLPPLPFRQPNLSPSFAVIPCPHYPLLEISFHRSDHAHIVRT